ncbi:MAG: F0F1 ATP synthase subunit A [Bacteroidota bacterium]
MNKNKSFKTLISALFLLIAMFFAPTSSMAAGGGDGPFSPSETALHHIADANAFHIVGDLYFHLPCMLYAPDHGWTFLSSTSKFKPHHGNGEVAIDRYVLHHGVVKRIADPNFPMGEVAVNFPGSHGHGEKAHHNESPSAQDHSGHDHSGHDHSHGGHDHSGHDHSGHDHGSHDHSNQANGGAQKAEAHSGDHIMYQGRSYAIHHKSTFDGGIAGGGITSYYDFSITKNVFSMILVTLLLSFVFRSVAKSYKEREGQAPKGLQSFIEPFFMFIRDDVAKPMIGEHKYERFLPYILAVFFFILALNLFGQIPFFPGSANVTGNISVTIVLAVFTFLITNLNGNSHYWQHVFWMPGIPVLVKLILTPVEVLGVILKPTTLFIRLFANITAGHIVVISFVGLIFVFGESGNNLVGAGVGIVASTILTLFMNCIELVVAFIQAYIFAILSASYIGAAVEDAHH